MQIAVQNQMIDHFLAIVTRLYMFMDSAEEREVIRRMLSETLELVTGFKTKLDRRRELLAQQASQSSFTIARFKDIASKQVVLQRLIVLPKEEKRERYSDLNLMFQSPQLLTLPDEMPMWVEVACIACGATHNRQEMYTYEITASDTTVYLCKRCVLQHTTELDTDTNWLITSE